MLVSTGMDYAACPQLWSLLLTGIGQGVCVPTGAVFPSVPHGKIFDFSPGCAKVAEGGCKAVRLIQACCFLCSGDSHSSGRPYGPGLFSSQLSEPYILVLLYSPLLTVSDSVIIITLAG